MDRRVLGAVADRGIPTMVFDDEALDSGKEAIDMRPRPL